jgi:hypothetical protein
MELAGRVRARLAERVFREAIAVDELPRFLIEDQQVAVGVMRRGAPLQ